MNTTQKLIKELNAIRGFSYPDIGYTMFQDVVGNGIVQPRIYTVINENGGVTFSSLNDTNPRKRCDNLRRAIESAYGEPECLQQQH